MGKPYSYAFKVVDGGTASWAPLTDLPLGLALDPATGVLSGVPKEAGTQQLLVSASRGSAHPALGSVSAVLTVARATNGAATIWRLPRLVGHRCLKWRRGRRTAA